MGWPVELPQGGQAGHGVVRMSVYSVEELGCPMPNTASLFLRLFPSLPLFWCPCFCSVVQGSSISRWSMCTGAEIRPQAMTGRARWRKASRCERSSGPVGGHVTGFLPRPQLPFHTVRWRLQQGFPHAHHSTARISCALYKMRSAVCSLSLTPRPSMQCWVEVVWLLA